MKYNKLSVTVTEQEARDIIAKHLASTLAIGDSNPSNVEVSILTEQSKFQYNKAVLDTPISLRCVQLIREDRLIDAIKELHNTTTLNLKEAKDQVELLNYVAFGGPAPQ